MGPKALLSLNWLLLAFALLVVAERMLARVFRLHFNADSLMEQVSKLIASGNIRRAVNLCGADLHNPLARVLEAGLKQAQAAPERRNSAMRDAIDVQIPRIRARIRWLLPIASVALLVGAVGGWVEDGAFEDGLQGPLRHVALGLAVGLFCALGYVLLGLQAKAMVAALEGHSVRLERLLAETPRSPALRQRDV